MIDKIISEALAEQIFSDERLEELLALGDDGEDLGFIIELFELFKTSSVPLSVGLREALAKNDERTIIFAAHKLKGSSSNLGLQKLAVICQLIENNPNTLNEKQRALLSLEIERSTQEILDQFPSYIKTRKSA